MSDYLSRAAERASGAQPAVRPWLPPLFDLEKSPTELVATISSSPQPQRDTETKRPSNAEEKTGHTESQVRERVISILSLAHQEALVERMARIVPMTARPQSGGVTAETDVHSTEAETATEKSLAGPEKKSHVVRLGSVTKPRDESGEPAADRRVAPAKAVVEAEIEAPQQQSPKSLRASAVEPARAVSPPSVAPSDVPRRRQAESTRIQSPNAPRRSGRESTSAPTIQVTIGRLEVRAVQAAPAPTPAPRKPPRISLEEYLRSRNKAAG
jgi:hypothetical protein